MRQIVQVELNGGRLYLAVTGPAGKRSWMGIVTEP
jgi:hypothetical protein